MKRIVVFFAAMILHYGVTAQPQEKTSVVIGQKTKKPNAILYLNPVKKDQGFLPPQLSTRERTAIEPVSPDDDGLIVFDTDEKQYYHWNDWQWQRGLSRGLLPDPAGNAGRLLTTDGLSVFWTQLEKVPLIQGGEGLSVSTQNNFVYISANPDRKSITINSNGQLEVQNAGITNSKIASGGKNKVMATDGEGSVVWTDRSAFSDDQTLSLDPISNTVSIENGNAVELGEITTGGQITGQLKSLSIADNSITSAQIQERTIDASDIADHAVSAAHLQDKSIQTNHLSSDLISSSELVDGSVSSSDIAENAITSTHVSDNTITSADVLNNTLSSDDISDGSLTSSDMAQGAVNSTTIADNSITSADILDGTIAGGDIAEGSIQSVHISGNSILSTHIATNSVNSAHLADNSIVSRHIASGSVSSAHLADNSIASNNIADNSIASIDILDNSLTGNDIRDGALTGADIAPGGALQILTTNVAGQVTWEDKEPILDNSVSNETITALTLTANQLVVAEGSVASQLDLNALSLTGNVRGNLNAITVTHIQNNPVSPAPLTAADAGKMMVWNGTQWVASATASNVSYYSIDPSEYTTLKLDNTTDKHNANVFLSDNTFLTAYRDGIGEENVGWIHLPHGSTIQEVMISYMDKDALRDMSVVLMRKSLTGGNEELLRWTSSGSNTVINTVSFTAFNGRQVVDNANYTYRIHVKFDMVNSDVWDIPDEALQRYYGVRIKYIH